MRKLGALLVVVAACGASTGNGGDTVDAQRSVDSGSRPGSDATETLDAPAALTITITGRVTTFGGTGVMNNATVAPYTASGGSAGSSVLTAPNGTFTLPIEATGAFDGYIEVTHAETLDTYVWPAAPLTTDLSGLEIETFGTAVDIQHQLFQQCGIGTYNDADGLIGVEVASLAAGVATGVSGAKVSIPTGADSVCYDKKFPAGDEVPAATPTATDTSGLGFILNVPASDSVALNASASGATFNTTTIPTVAGAYTMTFIVQQ